MKLFLLTLWQKIKSKKYIILGCVVITVVVLSIILPSKKTNIVTNTPTPTSTPLVGNYYTKTEPKRPDQSIVYLLNRFDSLSNIIGYTWNENKIVYATKDGIFKLWKNEPIVTTPISYASFNSTGEGIYANNSDYFLFKSEDETSVKIGSNLNKPQINEGGTYLVYQNINSLDILSLKDNTISTLNLPSNPNISFGWIDNKDLVYVFNKNTNEINLYDLSAKQIGQTKMNSGTHFIGFSPDGDKIITELSGTLLISNVGDKPLVSVQFDQGSIFHICWINSTEFVLTQTLERGSLGLFDDFMWKVDTNGNKLFLANSYPITNKFNLNIKTFINQDKNTLIFNENKGKIWTLSLIPGRVSTYSEQGISFYKLPTNRED